MPNKEITSIIRKVSSGKIVLFLGSGINKGCKNSSGQDAPDGNELALLIKDQFFPDEDVPSDLPTVCACTETRESRINLEKFIYDLLIDYKPSENVLKKIPKFNWRRIYTTNFDRLLEQAYGEDDERLQNLIPIYSDRDRQNFEFGRDIPYYKLHGCITKISTKSIPLILTSEDYANYRKNRERLFWRLADDLYENTFLFIGYSFSDPNFQNLFYELQSIIGDIRDFPRCYAIAPTVPPSVTEYWDSKKVAIIDLIASEFFKLLEETPVIKYSLPESQQDEIEHLKKSAGPHIDLEVASDILKTFDLVDERLGFEKTELESFYRGDKPSWYIIRNEGDAQRTYYEKIMDDILLVDETEKPESTEVAVITAEAGAGKTTLLMRMAYDHACSFEGFCLFHKGFRDISFQILEELYRILKKRIFIYLDDAADNIGTLSFIAHKSKALKIPITIMCAERKNEWNVVRDRLTPIIPIEYDLPYLDDDEIENVLTALEKNNYLCALENKSIDERRSIFKEKAHKQLLVAMREATEGDDFDRIIQNEYEDIPSELGRKTYLNICSLHRLGVPLRAGLLKRLSGVSFEDFKEKLLDPCERVIVTEYDDVIQTNLFRARHPHIAEIVCKHALTDGERIAESYMDILNKMDLGYNSDLYSFRELVRAGHIVDAMPSISYRRTFYDRALSLSGKDAFVYQQYGIMELRYNQLDRAEKYFSLACKLEPSNLAYQHSYARFLYRKSEKATNPAQKERLFKESQKILTFIMRRWPQNPYAYDSFTQNLISKSDELDEPMKQDFLKEAHSVLEMAIRFCLDKSYLQATEAKIFQRLGDFEKAKQSLLDSHHNNPASVRTGLLLGRFLMNHGDPDLAYQVVIETRRHNETHEGLNLLAAEISLKVTANDHNKIIDFLKNAYDPNYIDYRANFLLAVEYFRDSCFDEAEDIFSNFKRRKVYKLDGKSYTVREFLKDEQGNNLVCEGEVKILFGRKGFIKPDLIPKDVFFLPQMVYGGEIKSGTRVRFKIGFNLFGPIAQNIQVKH